MKFRLFFRGLLFFAILLSLSPAQPLINPWPATVTDLEYDDRLQAETDSLLTLFDQMPSVPVYIKDVPILKMGTNIERGVAYTNCEGHENPIIFVKKSFYKKANQKQLSNILKHELTHAWLCRQSLMSGHDARFREKLSQVGGFGN